MCLLFVLKGQYFNVTKEKRNTLRNLTRNIIIRVNYFSESKGFSFNFAKSTGAFLET